jgi:hypothetical protein
MILLPLPLALTTNNNLKSTLFLVVTNYRRQRSEQSLTACARIETAENHPLCINKAPRTKALTQCKMTLRAA